MGEEKFVAPSIPIAPAPQQGAADTTSDSKSESSKAPKEVRQPFPWKVYEMLEDAEALGFDDIVSWNAMGNGFVVHDKERFTKEVISKYFKQSRYKSFQRQLSLYGFDRSTDDGSKGLRSHPKLLRGQKHLCRQMKPVGYKPRGRDKKSHCSSSASEVSSKDDGIVGIRSPTDQESTTYAKQRIPSVVSSESIYRTHPISPCPDSRSEEFDQHFAAPSDSRPRTSITERLVTTDSKVVFEGMPFYLMVSLPPESVQDTEAQRENVPPLPPGAQLEVGSSNSQIMKKAWDIGFAAAKTYSSASDNSSEIVPMDVLDDQLNTIV